MVDAPLDEGVHHLYFSFYIFLSRFAVCRSLLKPVSLGFLRRLRFLFTFVPLVSWLFSWFIWNSWSFFIMVALRREKWSWSRCWNCYSFCGFRARSFYKRFSLSPSGSYWRSWTKSPHQLSTRAVCTSLTDEHPAGSINAQSIVNPYHRIAFCIAVKLSSN